MHAPEFHMKQGCVTDPMEEIMKRTSAILSAFFLLASTCAFAQSTGDNAKPGGNGALKVQPGASGKSMGHAANAGTARASSGTLMQRRESAMSPQGASGTNETGKMKQ